MDIHFTARHFKANKELRDYAISSIQKLDRFYDGILRSDIILSYERQRNSVKIVEINLRVHRQVLNVKEKSDDYYKSIDLAIDKLIRQLDKFKSKLHMKDKKLLNRVKKGID